MSFPRYPAYKASGVEWLGEVPEHWEVGRLKRSTVSAKNGVWGDEAKQDANDIPCVRVADFDRQGLRVELDEPTIRNVVDSDRVGRILVQGDLLLEKSGGGEGQPVGCVVLYDDPRPAVCSNFVARIQTAPCMSSPFWRYVHAAAYAVRLNTRSIKQTSGIQNLDASQYFDERAGFPPLAEQTQIATFLDHETAKIDALVAEQRRLMELLKEKRQAVISHAVTRGLNPNAPMKPSGVEWLGDVPLHWEASSFRHCLNQMFNGLTATQVDETAHTVPVTRIETISYGVIDDQKLGFINLEDARADRLLLPGDILFSNINSLNMVGKCAFYAGGRKIYAGMNLLVLRPEVTKCDPLWLCWLVRSASFRCVVESLAKPAINQASISQSSINSITVAVPPIPEQIQIAAFLDSETAKFDTLTAEAQLAIDLLQERRTALISAAVTGQIDVRGKVQAL